MLPLVFPCAAAYVAAPGPLSFVEGGGSMSPTAKTPSAAYVHETCLTHPERPEPVLFQTGEEPNGFDAQCVLRRHQYYYGKKYLPLPGNRSDLREGQSEWNGMGSHLLTVAQPMTDIPEVNSSVVLSDYSRRLKPFVIRGGAASLPAMEKWSDDYLATHGGDVTKDVDGKTLTSAIKKKQYWSQGTPERLLQDAPILPPFQRWTESLEKITFWYAPIGYTRSFLHRDDGNFVVAQIDGTKTWHLVDPDYSLRLYADFGEEYNLSPVPGNDVQLDRYPEIADVPVRVLRLHAGDVLYLPRGYWHFVESGFGRNVALTYQFNACDEEIDFAATHYSKNYTAWLQALHRD